MPTDERLVVTEADPDERVVVEINGLPAAEEYARILGVDAGELDPVHFAASPVVVLIDGANYVRSIQKAKPDGSLKFYCAIERGVVLRVARGVDLVANLESAFSRVRAQIGPPQLVLTFDCILRKLEIAEGGLETRSSEILRRNNAVGFNTYGEQFCGVHVNQTLTAIALGSGAHAAGREAGMPDSGAGRTPGRRRPSRPRSSGSTRSWTRSWTASEASMNVQGSDFGLFQTTIMLQDQVRLHTEELEAALRRQGGRRGRLRAAAPGDMQTLRRTAALQIQLLELVVQQKDVGELIERVAAILDMPIVALRHARPRRVRPRGRAAGVPDLAPRLWRGLRAPRGRARPRWVRRRRRRARLLPRRPRDGSRRARAGRRATRSPAARSSPAPRCCSCSSS